jgi:hypothetical protein
VDLKPGNSVRPAPSPDEHPVKPARVKQRVRVSEEAGRGGGVSPDRRPGVEIGGSFDHVAVSRSHGETELKNPAWELVQSADYWWGWRSGSSRGKGGDDPGAQCYAPT